MLVDTDWFIVACEQQATNNLLVKDAINQYEEQLQLTTNKYPWAIQLIVDRFYSC